MDAVATYPEISGTSIEVQIERLCWSTNLNWAEVFGIVLLIICRHFTSLACGSSNLLG
jgi:hypothetical protein